MASRINPAKVNPYLFPSASENSTFLSPHFPKEIKDTIQLLYYLQLVELNGDSEKVLSDSCKTLSPLTAFTLVLAARASITESTLFTTSHTCPSLAVSIISKCESILDAFTRLKSNKNNSIETSKELITNIITMPLKDALKMYYKLYEDTLDNTNISFDLIIQESISTSQKVSSSRQAQINVLKIFAEKSSNEKSNLMLTGLTLLLSYSLRYKIALNIFTTHLKLMNVPEIVIQALSSLRLSLTESQSGRFGGVWAKKGNGGRGGGGQGRGLESLRWRVDVVLSSGSLTKVMKPNLLMQVRINYSFSFNFSFIYFSFIF